MSLQLAARICRLAAARGFTVTAQALAPAEYAVQLERDGATVYKSPGFRTREQARVVAETMVGWELPTP